MNNTNDAEQWLLTPDLSEATEMSDGALPPGVYKARVTGMEKLRSKGNPSTGSLPADYIKWTLTIFGAEGELSKYNNWKVYHNTMLSGKGTGITKAFVKACTGQELEGAFNFALLHGAELQVTLKEGQPYNGAPAKFPEVARVEQISQH